MVWLPTPANELLDRRPVNLGVFAPGYVSLAPTRDVTLVSLGRSEEEGTMLAPKMGHCAPST